MLLEFTDDNGRPVWINPKYVVMIPGGTDPCLITLEGGQRYFLRGSGNDVSRRINEALAKDSLRSAAIQASQFPSYVSPTYPYRDVRCIHCGHSYAEQMNVVYICGAMPMCPVCNKTQSSWEAGRPFTSGEQK